MQIIISPGFMEGVRGGGRKMKLSEYIRGKIAENKWTYNQAAEFYDVSPTTITGTVNGKFDIPSMRLLRKYAAKENTDEYALLNKLSYLPIVEKDMTASAEVMDKIRKEEDEWFEYSRRLLWVQFMVSTKKRFPDFNEKNVILVDDNTCDPARSSYLKNIISDIISSTSRHDSPLHYIAYIDKDPDETISYSEAIDLFEQNRIRIWGCYVLRHDSIGKVALTTEQLIDRILIDSFKIPYFDKVVIMFTNMEEHKYSVDKYRELIKNPPVEVHFLIGYPPGGGAGGMIAGVFGNRGKILEA